MGLVVCFMFAFFGILLCTGCSISSTASKNETERRIRDRTNAMIVEGRSFTERFVMTDEEEYDFRQKIFSESGLQHTYKTCKEFCKPIKECDAWFAELDSFASMLIYDQRFVTTIIRIMAAETGRIAHFDANGIDRGIGSSVEDRRYYIVENKILQLIDKKLMTCGCSPLLFTDYDIGIGWKKVDDAKYILQSVQKVKEFNDGIYVHGVFKWMNAGMYSSAEMVYLDRGGRASL